MSYDPPKFDEVDYDDVVDEFLNLSSDLVRIWGEKVPLWNESYGRTAAAWKAKVAQQKKVVKRLEAQLKEHYHKPSTRPTDKKTADKADAYVILDPKYQAEEDKLTQLEKEYDELRVSIDSIKMKAEQIPSLLGMMNIMDKIDGGVK